MAKKREGDLGAAPHNIAQEEDVKEEEAEAEGRKRGGAKRKKGGMIPGGLPMGRPDRRARGGATSDKNPTTAAGNVSSPEYLTKGVIAGYGGAGKDNPGKNG